MSRAGRRSDIVARAARTIAARLRWASRRRGSGAPYTNTAAPDQPHKLPIGSEKVIIFTISIRVNTLPPPVSGTPRSAHGTSPIRAVRHPVTGLLAGLLAALTTGLVAPTPA